MIETKVLNLLKTSNKPLSIEEISRESNINFEDLNKCILNLQNEKKIRFTKKNRIESTKFKFGNIRINNKGYGFVDFPNEDSIYIAKENLKNVIDGDFVAIDLIDKNKKEGIIIKVISHERESEIGEIYTDNNEYYAKLDDINKDKVRIKIKNINLPIVNGSKVKLNIGDLIKNNLYEGEIKSIICHVNDPDSDIISKAEMFGIKTSFNNETLKEANLISQEVMENEKQDRKDLRNNVIFTIDGNDSKDFDDAVSIEKLDNGNYKLGVHIADVAHYVKKGSELDKEASSRGLSSYLADKVIPMLPYSLSNGICSLNPLVDRLTKTCEMIINKDGKIINFEIYDSIINSKKRMTYEKVNDVLNDNISDESYLPFVNELKMMYELSKIIRKKRIKAGCIEFDESEMEILVDKNGKVLDVLNLKRIESQKIIEDFMISANVCIAEYFSYMYSPCIYRIHDKPKKENIEEFFNFLKSTKEKVGKLPKNLTSKLIGDLLNTLKDSPNFEIYSSLLLKSMQKARYSTTNIGHFGLSEKNYLHFTSPIRRYSDLIVHRLLDDIKLQNLNNNIEEFQTISNHISNKELNSVKCEREVNKMKSAQFMLDKIGTKYTGKIVSISEKGIFVNIYNGIEGLIKFSKEDDYKYNDRTYSVTFNNNVYRIGDQMEVMLKNVNVITGYIDLKLVKNNNKVLVKNNRR